MSRPADLSSLKIGSYIIIDGEPCKIVEYDKSKTGKHGSAKARIVAIGVFDSSKKSLLSPVASMVEVPLIEKKSGQVISITGNILQIMDLETFETFELPFPKEDEVAKLISQGTEVEYWNVLGKSKIMRVKGKS
ncbi:MAG: translation initiation factor IF-5A [Nitrososphaeria archaeon]